MSMLCQLINLIAGQYGEVPEGCTIVIVLQVGMIPSRQGLIRVLLLPIAAAGDAGDLPSRNAPRRRAVGCSRGGGLIRARWVRTFDKLLHTTPVKLNPNMTPTTSDSEPRPPRHLGPK